MAWRSKTTHEAWVASPAVWEMSKHSMRRLASVRGGGSDCDSGCDSGCGVFSGAASFGVSLWVLLGALGVVSSMSSSSTSASARVRACCEPSSAKRRASCRAALCCAICSQMRRCSRGWCTTLICRPAKADRASSRAGRRAKGVTRTGGMLPPM